MGNTVKRVDTLINEFQEMWYVPTKNMDKQVVSPSQSCDVTCLLKNGERVSNVASLSWLYFEQQSSVDPKAKDAVVEPHIKGNEAV